MEREANGSSRCCARGLTALLGAAFAVAAVFVLLSYSAAFDPSRLHVFGLESRLNDQAAYVTTARILADTGELRNGLVYPPFVDNPRSRIYMPGHYVTLALSYRLFGWSVFSSLLPSLAAFVVATVGVFWIGSRLYGATAGVLAGLIFLFFPPNIVFAFTAMAELTFVAAGVLVFAVFLWVPPRLRFYVAPLLLGVPFLYRETGALLLLPMCTLALAEPPGKRVRFALATLLGSVALLLVLYQWQAASGREAPPLTWITHGGFNYNDAAMPPAPDLSGAEWVGAILDNSLRNVRALGRSVFSAPAGFEALGLAGMLATSLLLAVGGLFRVRNDPFPAAAGGVVLASLASIVVLYDAVGFKALRGAMFGMPLCGVALGGLLQRTPLVARLEQAVVWRRAGLAALIALALLLAGRGPTLAAARGVTANDAAATSRTAWLEDLGHDADTLLVAPWNLSMDYVVQHYPVRWSFLPANDATLDRLRDRYEIGTLILPRAASTRRVTRAAIERAGLSPVDDPAKTLVRRGYAVYQRDRGPGTD